MVEQAPQTVLGFAYNCAVVLTSDISAAPKSAVIVLTLSVLQSAFHRLEASAMISGEGEEVDFSHPVNLDGPVEAWLADLENAMQVRS